MGIIGSASTLILANDDVDEFGTRLLERTLFPHIDTVTPGDTSGLDHSEAQSPDLTQISADSPMVLGQYTVSVFESRSGSVKSASDAAIPSIDSANTFFAETAGAGAGHTTDSDIAVFTDILTQSIEQRSLPHDAGNSSVADQAHDDARNSIGDGLHFGITNVASNFMQTSENLQILNYAQPMAAISTDASIQSTSGSQINANIIGGFGVGYGQVLPDINAHSTTIVTEMSGSALASATTQSVTTAGSALVFNNTFSAACTAQFMACVVTAEQQLASLFSNSLTLNLSFDEQAAGTNASNSAYNIYSSVNVSYSQLLAKLPSSDGLPASDPTGGHTFSIPEAYARMLGLSSSTPTVDDSVTFNSSFNWSYGQDVVNVIEHEISEGGMGRVGGLGDSNGVWSTMDLFRYSSPNVRDLTDGRDGRATYFSANGNSLSSLSFNNEYNGSGIKANGGDTADFSTTSAGDVFGGSSTGETFTFSPTDTAIMNALGWSSRNHIPPTLKAGNFSVSQNQSISFGSDITVSNPSNDSITSCWVEDLGGGGGHLSVGGIIAGIGTPIKVSSDWSGPVYTGGSNTGTDQLVAMMFDATTGAFIYSQPFNATTTAGSSPSGPTIAGRSVTVPENQTTSVIANITVSNPSNHSIASYWVEDLGGGSGHLTVDGATVGVNNWVQVIQSNFADVQYVGGSIAGTDQLDVAMYDSTLGGFIFSSPFNAITTAPITGPAPAVFGGNFSVSENKSIGIAVDITVSNPRNDSINGFWVRDHGGGSGHLSVGGTTIGDGIWVQASSNWSNVLYTGGATPGTEELEVEMGDLTTGEPIYSQVFKVTTTVGGTHFDPSVFGQTLSVPVGQSIGIASDISVSNPSTDSISSYWVEGLGGGSGHLIVGGNTIANNSWVQASSNWANVQYVGGLATGADQLLVKVVDGTSGSTITSSPFNATTTTAPHVPPTTFQQEVVGLYSALYNRAADITGYAYWLGLAGQQSDAKGLMVANAGSTAVTTADASLLGQAFVTSQSTFFQTTYGVLTDNQFVNAMYLNIGGAAGDSNGIAYWSGILAQSEAQGQSVQAARAGLAGQFVQELVGFDIAVRPSGLTDQQWATALTRQQTLDNKITVSEAYLAASNQTGGEILIANAVGDAAYQASIKVLGNVTSDPTTAATALVGITNVVVHHDLTLI